MAGKIKAPLPEMAPNQWMALGCSMGHQRRVGRIAVSWSWLEDTIESVIWLLLGVSMDDGRVFTAKADANRKIQWLCALARLKLSDAERDQIDPLLKELNELRVIRNFVVHGSWAILQPDGIHIAMSTWENSPPGVVSSETFPDWRMEEIGRRIELAKIVIMSWEKKHAASRGISLPQSAER